MFSLLKFLEYAIQGIEFYLILDEDYSTQRQKLHDVISRLPSEELRRDILRMSFEDLFTNPQGREIVKEMVNVMVGLGVSGKTSVEAVTETLRVRCPAFCSGDDVIVYRVLPLPQTELIVGDRHVATCKGGTGRWRKDGFAHGMSVII